MDLVSDYLKAMVDGTKDIFADYYDTAKFVFRETSKVLREVASENKRDEELQAFLSTPLNQPPPKREYERLPAEEGLVIRLIRLLPGEDLDEVKCVLKPSSLGAAYEALSYCWGDLEKCSPIVCDGVPFKITHNLKLALNSLRLPDRERILWVDAVCINQDDMSEREQQVSIMREIYSRAQRTIVYLGETSIASTMSFGIL